MKNRYLILIAFNLTFLNTVAFSQQPLSPLVASFQEHLKMKEQSTFGLEWIPLGPVLNGSLVETFQIDNNHPGTIYLGFGSGNLWKTVNNGLTWKPIFENQPAYGIGDVALAPSNTNIIYLGTGETLKKPRNFTMPGTGVYRSDDGGENWRHLGLDDSWQIGKIVVHPTNPDIVYVAVLGHFWSPNVNRGIFRSMNGGNTWEHVLFVDDKTGANDIVIAPSNPKLLYASLWENNPGINGKQSNIYRSTDAGKTWIKSDIGFPQDDGKGRIGLAVSYTNPNKVYALMDHRNKDANQGAAEVYQSLNGGKTWNRTHQEELMINSVVGWYFADIFVDPQNDDEIYALGVRLAHSTDAGKTFNLMGGDVYHLFPSPAEPLHLDQDELWINPKNSNHLALGNDGGFYMSYDKGLTWLHYNNIPTGEFYDITLDHKTPYTIYGGTQDDATAFGTAKEWHPRVDNGWKYLWIDPWSGGDGCITAVDPIDSNTVYYSAQEGAIQRLNKQKSESISVRPNISDLNGSIRYNFISPYFLSTHNHNSLYLAGNYVMRSTDRGDNWKAISGDLSIGKDTTKNSLAAGALAESELEQGLIYMGTDKGLFWVTKDDGATWTEQSLGLPNAYIRCITPSRFKKSRVYIALSGINYDDFGTYLYQSDDYGNTWKSLKTNLPSEIAYVIKEDPTYENVLYAGLYRAVYISIDQGASWSMLGKEMPAAAVADLEIDKSSKDLVAATHGRGIYKMNLSPIYEKLNTQSTDDVLFDVSMVNVSTPFGTRDDSNSRYVEKMPISFWLNQAADVTIKIISQTNETEWQTPFKAKKGYNQYRWDLITKRVNSPLPYYINQNELLKIGKYTIELNVQGKVLTKAFEAIK